MKAKTKSYYKKKAWKAFSEYIRRSNIDKDLQLVKCYTCNTWADWKEMQAGHAIGGRGNAVLFMEELVRPQCVSDNVFKRGDYPTFTRKLIGEYGLERYDQLVAQAKAIVQFKVQDYIEIENKYKELLKNL